MLVVYVSWYFHCTCKYAHFLTLSNSEGLEAATHNRSNTVEFLACVVPNFPLFKNTTPSFSPSPLLNLQTVQDPTPFSVTSLNIVFTVNPSSMFLGYLVNNMLIPFFKPKNTFFISTNTKNNIITYIYTSFFSLLIKKKKKP